jgi:flagellar biosynthetic protein FliP
MNETAEAGVRAWSWLLRWSLVLELLTPMAAWSAPGFDAITVTTNPDGGQSYTLTLQILFFMTALSLLPSALVMMTSFARITISLHLLRQAMGTHTAPSNQMLIGLALFLTIFIMMPVFDQIYQVALKPYMAEEITFQDALARGAVPLKEFMMAQTRDSDIELFAEIGRFGEIEGPEQVPFSLLLPAFATSEIKTGFQIGFLLFIPFLVIDLVVASVLMSMGMMMLSPMIVSLPFKIMLFVLIDGWGLVFGALASSFYLEGVT